MKGHYLYPQKRSSSFNLIVGTHKTTIPKLAGVKCYKQRVYPLGDITYIYNYEEPVWAGYNKFKTGNRKPTDEETKKENRKKVIIRIRNNVIMLALLNFDEHSRFLTLTFKDNITDIFYANREFKKFIQRVKHKYGDFRYLVVIQFQKRGAIHYHMLADFVFIEQAEIEKIWGNGFVWINDLLHANNGKPVDDVGRYICGYMNKKLDDLRLRGKKAYFTSKNIIRPKAIYENLSIEECKEKYSCDDKNLEFANSYMSEKNGRVDFYEFNKKY